MTQMQCDLNRERLQLWFDGELRSADVAAVTQHVETCEGCSRQMAGWERSREQLREMVDAGIGTIEPLRALQSIRQRIEQANERSIVFRLGVWWQDMWTFNRRAMAGIAVAAAVGALTAPVAVYWAGSLQQSLPSMAAVVVESLELGDGARAVVYHPQGDSTTTIIWVESD